jgi:hypothetical protein
MKEARVLRGRLDGERRAQASKRHCRFSAVLKREVAEYVSEARRRNVSESQLQADLGLSPATLIRWCGCKSKEPAVFRQVAMVRTPRQVGIRPAELVPVPHRLANGIAPIAIVGLTVSEIAELCRSLGC